MRVPIESRPLSSKESALAEMILAEFLGAVELRNQLDQSRVVALWGVNSSSDTPVCAADIWCMTSPRFVSYLPGVLLRR